MNIYSIALRITLFFALMLVPVAGRAETWDQIQNSGEYYWGVGYGSTNEEATQDAYAQLVRSIATHVSMDFRQIEDEKVINDQALHQSSVLSCLKTYSQASLTNVRRWPLTTGTTKNGDVEARLYMKRSELSKMFENRISKAKEKIRFANEALAKRKIETALQSYYYAYSLLRSLQFPEEVKDGEGRVLVEWLPLHINGILEDVDVQFAGRDGDDVDLTFTYQGQPVTNIAYNYSNGRDTELLARGKDGKGAMYMVPGYETDIYHLDIEYQFRSLARGDAEMESVLGVLTPRPFSNAEKTVKDKAGRAGRKALAENAAAKGAGLLSHIGVTVPDATKANESTQANVIDKVAKAIATRRYSDAEQYFTLEGMEMYNRLISYGTARIIGKPEIKYYQGLGGRTIARGLQMAFSFQGKRKKTFVEDITFTFNADNKIENVAFGLGKVAEEGILHRAGAAWREDVRESIVEFMENYKTAYSLEDIDYIRSIFADDARIIIGNVAKPQMSRHDGVDGMTLSLSGQQIITTNEYTKEEYLKRLEKCFGRNDFINLQFADHEVQWLEKFNDKSLFAINIRQQYDSSTYADEGYLFLLVDMIDRDEPLIKIRTWQPNDIPIDQLYNAGDFF